MNLFSLAKKWRIITVTILGIFICPNFAAEAEPGQSPAGGQYLKLDDDHDFVSTAEAWFPNEQFEGLTAEAWIYVETMPAAESFWSIFGQENRFYLVIVSSGSLGSWCHEEGAGIPCGSGGNTLPKEEWVHVTALFHASAGFALNGVGGNWGRPGGKVLESDKPLIIGGIIPQKKELCYFVGTQMKFRGYIDELRISNVVRYVGPKFQVPEQGFEVDEHTIGLWHFDETSKLGYKDQSDYGNTLWLGGIKNVEPRGKLSTIWCKIKLSN